MPVFIRLSPLARAESLTLLAIGVLLSLSVGLVWHWALAVLPLLLMGLIVLTFRDPERQTPVQRQVMVSPVDGKITSVHEVEHVDALDGPALCIRIFISLLDVHVVRSPAHCAVGRIVEHPGKFRNAIKLENLENNTNRLIMLDHAVKGEPIGGLRLIAGAFARTIATPIETGQTMQRGQRLGIIKLGSAAELYVSKELEPTAEIRVGDKVKAGQSILLRWDKRESQPSQPQSKSQEQAEDSIQSKQESQTDTPASQNDRNDTQSDAEAISSAT